jgi:hypothetical protein
MALYPIQGRDPQTHQGRFGPDGLQHLQQQPGPVGHRSAVGTLAPVAAVPQEGVQQVAVGAVDLDPVEAGVDGVAGRLPEPRHDPGQFIVGQLPGDDVGLLPLRGVHLVTGDGDRARRHRLTAPVEQGVAGPPAMPDLQHDAPSGGMDRVGGEQPPHHLGRRMDAGLVPEGRMALHHHRGLGDQQAGAGSLAVVSGHQGARHMVRLGPASGEGGHQDPVGQQQRAHLQGGEQVAHGVVTRRPGRESPGP